jgi:hypothetical protein
MSKVRLQFRENDQVLASQFKCHSTQSRGSKLLKI